MREGGCKRSGVRQVGRERRGGRESIEVGECSRVTRDVCLIRRLEGWDLSTEPRTSEHSRHDKEQCTLTISWNSAPTLSSPLPPSSAPPRASSKRSTK